MNRVIGKKQMKKILIYGIGQNCKRFLRYSNLSNIDVVGYVDKFRYGSLYRNKTVLHPSEIHGMMFDEILVTPGDSDGIIEELVVEFGINRNAIKDVEYINKHYLLTQIKDKKFVFFELIGVFECIYREVLSRNDVAGLCLLKDNKIWKLDDDIDTEDRIFIFAINEMDNYYAGCICEYLRSHYMNSKQVMIFYDQVDGKHGLKNRFPYFDINGLKCKMDRVITYHKADALQYGIEQRDMVYSDISDEVENADVKYDVLFLGYAKNRLNKIYSIYNRFSQAGYRCSFWLVGVDESERRYEKGLNYVDPINYVDYLKLLSESLAILEVCDDGDESTLRYYESIIYHKKLLTDDRKIVNRKYYHKENILCFSSVDDIMPEWLNHPMVGYSYDNDYSPVRLLDYLNVNFHDN